MQSGEVVNVFGKLKEVASVVEATSFSFYRYQINITAYSFLTVFI